jgi:hypothetical protein
MSYRNTWSIESAAPGAAQDAVPLSIIQFATSRRFAPCLTAGVERPLNKTSSINVILILRLLQFKIPGRVLPFYHSVHHFGGRPSANLD